MRPFIDDGFRARHRRTAPLNVRLTSLNHEIEVCDRIVHTMFRHSMVEPLTCRDCSVLACEGFTKGRNIAWEVTGIH